MDVSADVSTPVQDTNPDTQSPPEQLKDEACGKDSNEPKCPSPAELTPPSGSGPGHTPDPQNDAQPLTLSNVCDTKDAAVDNTHADQETSNVPNEKSSQELASTSIVSEPIIGPIEEVSVAVSSVRMLSADDRLAVSIGTINICENFDSGIAAEASSSSLRYATAEEIAESSPSPRTTSSPSPRYIDLAYLVIL